MAVEELGVGEFFFLNFNVARDVACHKTYHQVAGEGPGLAGKVTYVVDLETCFFHHLAAHTLLEALTCFYKTSHKAVVVAAEVEGTHHKNLVASLDTDNDGWGYGRVDFEPTLWAFAGNVGKGLGLGAADGAEFAMGVPIENLASFDGCGKVGGVHKGEEGAEIYGNEVGCGSWGLVGIGGGPGRKAYDLIGACGCGHWHNGSGGGYKGCDLVEGGKGWELIFFFADNHLALTDHDACFHKSLDWGRIRISGFADGGESYSCLDRTPRCGTWAADLGVIYVAPVGLWSLS